MTDDPEGTVHQLFAARAAASPAAVAVTCGDRTLTWADLQARADALAARLHSAGVAPGATVALLLDAALDLPVAPLAVLAAGGACAVLDPAQPPGRLAQLLAGARPRAVLAHRALARRLPPQRVPVVFLDDDPADQPAPAALAASPPAASPAAAPLDGSSPAWVHGLPQAVLVSHRQLVERFTAGGDAPDDLPGIAPLWALYRDAHLAIVPTGAATTPTPTPVPAGTAPRAAALAGGHTGPPGLGHAGPPGLGYAGLPGHASQAGPSSAATGDGGSDFNAIAAMGGGAGRDLDFSLFYFGNYSAGHTADHYRLVLEGARFADRHGWKAIWTPERHFHEFGGLYPNPSVMSGALAAITERLQIRAGSVVLPLHNPLRVAEEWSLVDNLSHGRVGVSVASGWHANDFVLDPAAYPDRHAAMKRGIDTVRRLWRGESLRLPSGTGAEVEVRIYPRPVQRDLPIWVTAAGSPDTFRLAGEVGAGVLTHMLGQEAAEIAAKIRVYRDAWRQAGHPGAGWVTVMLHTYVGPTVAEVHAVVRQPLGAYLKTSFGLLRSLAKSVGLDEDPNDLAAADLDLLVARAYDRYVAEGSGLIGTPDTCARTLERLRQMQVDEVACLIDFGATTDQVLAGLAHLDEVRRRTASIAAAAPHLATA